MKKAQLLKILENIPAGVAYLNRNLQVTYVNTLAKLYHGYPGDTPLSDLTLEHLLSPEIMAEITPAIQELLTKGKKQIIFGRTDAAGNLVDESYPYQESYFYRTTYMPDLEEGEVKGMIVLLEEITDLKRAEYSLQEKNTALEGFMYLLSHEVKGPILTVNGLADVLKKRYGQKLDSSGQEQLNLMNLTSQYLMRLIQVLTQFALLDTQDWEKTEVDIHELVQQAIQQHQDGPRPQEAEIYLHGDSGKLQVVPTLIQQVISNLLSNAIKYRHPDRPPVIHISIEWRGPMAVIRVQDNGIGIPPESHQKVFEMFVRLGENSGDKSFGMGLSFCQKVIHLHGGNISLESSEAGSTFIIHVPK